jgi:hypothetical protein
MDAQEIYNGLSVAENSQGGASRFLHIDKRPLSSFARADRPVQPIIAMLLGIMVKNGLSAADVSRLAGLPVESFADSRRGRVHIGRKRRSIGNP